MKAMKKDGQEVELRLKVPKEVARFYIYATPVERVMAMQGFIEGLIRKPYRRRSMQKEVLLERITTLQKRSESRGMTSAKLKQVFPSEAATLF